MMQIIIAMCLLYLAYRISSSEKNKHSDAKETQELLAQRAATAEHIDAWAEETRRSSGRKKVIESWTFAKGRADMLYVKFRGEAEAVYGKVFFLYDKGIPRVSRFMWDDKDGKRQYVSGIQLPVISKASLIKSYQMAKQDARKLQYINQVAREALVNGQAVFSICDYEGILPYAVAELFGRREMNALKEVLEEDFNVIEVDYAKGTYLVSCHVEPQLI